MTGTFQTAAEAVGSIVKRFTDPDQAVAYVKELAGDSVSASHLPDPILSRLADPGFAEPATYADTRVAVSYARAGIAEYWVLDITGRRMIVHRDPQAGRYASVAAYGSQESVAPLAAPQSCFRIKDAFPE